jgi:hypothetical protein
LFFSVFAYPARPQDLLANRGIRVPVPYSATCSPRP